MSVLALEIKVMEITRGFVPVFPLDSVHVRISIALCRGRFSVNWFEVRDFVDIAETVNHHCINFLFLKAKE